jgi:uncharacterized protein with gpF-like domain
MMIDTTKKAIRNIIKKGTEDLLSHQQIAKKIVSTGRGISIVRAKKIARTETGTGAAKSIHSAMDNSRLVKEKEWVSALDSRTRRKLFNHVIPNGERVPMEEYFKKTGEDLEYPKDSAGSAGNVINCRCVALYHTSISNIGF